MLANEQCLGLAIKWEALKVYYSFLEKCNYEVFILTENTISKVLTLIRKWSCGLKGKTAWCLGFTKVSAIQM